ncbi:hypothetical protein M5E06_32930 [Azospirillum sp. A1-3]|uniref:hypothetical protein n=1 Tax=Azospirillum sp. A1-3 TaxID=185874 RepID=UPI002076E82D|nr:hypothetical protein [Azospirillum sp. A1-3]MCM8738893.1 hypothetical protein [Azospirillum sp. A1-3]
MAQVMVWLPSVSKNTRGNKGLNVGHAALLADRAAKPSYVSWWPKGGADLNSPMTNGHSTPSYAHDVQQEGGMPTIVDLPCLNDTAISQWWARIKDSGFAAPYSLECLPQSRNYHLFENNCSTVVFRAMLIGGAREVADFPAFATMTPPHILAWARRLQLAQMQR